MRRCRHPAGCPRPAGRLGAQRLRGAESALQLLTHPVPFLAAGCTGDVDPLLVRLKGLRSLTLIRTTSVAPSINVQSLPQGLEQLLGEVRLVPPPEAPPPQLQLPAPDVLDEDELAAALAKGAALARALRGAGGGGSCAAAASASSASNRSAGRTLAMPRLSSLVLQNWPDLIAAAGGASGQCAAWFQPAQGLTCLALDSGDSLASCRALLAALQQLPSIHPELQLLQLQLRPPERHCGGQVWDEVLLQAMQQAVGSLRGLHGLRSLSLCCRPTQGLAPELAPQLPALLCGLRSVPQLRRLMVMVMVGPLLGWHLPCAARSTLCCAGGGARPTPARDDGARAEGAADADGGGEAERTEDGRFCTGITGDRIGGGIGTRSALPNTELLLVLSESLLMEWVLDRDRECIGLEGCWVGRGGLLVGVGVVGGGTVMAGGSRIEGDTLRASDSESEYLAGN